MKVLFHDPYRELSYMEVGILRLFDKYDNIPVKRMNKAPAGVVQKMEDDCLIISYSNRHGKLAGYMRSIHGEEMLRNSLIKKA